MPATPAADAIAAGIAAVGRLLTELPPELQPPDPQSPPGRILRAARDLHALHGLGKVTTRAVAARAQVNLALIHYYFGSKEKLIQATIRAEILNVMRDVFSGMDASLRGADHFVQFPLRLVEALRKDPVRLRLLRHVLATSPERLTQAIDTLGAHGIRGASGVMLARISAEQDEARLPAMAPRSILLYLLASAYGLVFIEPVARALLGFRLDDESDWREHRDNLQRLLRGGLLDSKEKEA